MKKLLILLSILTITACGGGSGDGSSDPGVTWTPGIYEITFTPDAGEPFDATFMVTSTNEFAVFKGLYPYIGNVNGVNMATSGGIFTATLSSATSGSYTDTTGDGTFEIANLGYYGRSSSLQKLNGTWVADNSLALVGSSTWTIDGEGRITMMSESLCTASGEYSTINADSNEYTVSFTVSNCAENGVYTGFGFTSDSSFEDDAFNMVAIEENGGKHIFGSLIKQ